MSRFFLVDAPALAPGACWFTKTSDGPFIDTGYDLSKHVIDRGRVYISVSALREMAQVAGLFDEKEPISVEMKKKEWYDTGYNDAIKELKTDAVNNFVERVLAGPVSTAGAATLLEPTSNHTAAGAAVPDVADAATGAPEDDSSVDEVERESASTGSVKRPSRVSTNSSDDANFRL